MNLINKGMEKHDEGYKRLTENEVRKVDGYQAKSDEEVQTIILSIEKLAALFFKRLARTFQQK